MGAVRLPQANRMITRVLAFIWMLNFSCVRTLKRPCRPCLDDQFSLPPDRGEKFSSPTEDRQEDCCNEEGPGPIHSLEAYNPLTIPTRPPSTKPAVSSVISGEDLDTFYETLDELDVDVEGQCCTAGAPLNNFTCGSG